MSFIIRKLYLKQLRPGSPFLADAFNLLHPRSILFQNQRSLGTIFLLQIESISEMVFPPQESVEIIRHQQNLRENKDEVHSLCFIICQFDVKAETLRSAVRGKEPSIPELH